MVQVAVLWNRLQFSTGCSFVEQGAVSYRLQFCGTGCSLVQVAVLWIAGCCLWNTLQFWVQTGSSLWWYRLQFVVQVAVLWTGCSFVEEVAICGRSCSFVVTVCSLFPAR